MTVGLAWREDDCTYIGADRLLSWGGTCAVGRPKITRIGPHVIVCAGHYAAVQALSGRRAELPPPPAPGELEGWLEAEMIPAMRRILRISHTRLDGDLIYATRGCRPVGIEEWQLLYMRPLVIGSGGEAALSAWHALGDIDPAERLRRSLRAACQVRTDCGGGITTLALP